MEQGSLICVAQLLSQSQLEILKKENIKVIIALDNDETGGKRSEALGEQLKEAKILYEIRRILPPYDQTCKDVDDLTSIRKRSLLKMFFRSIHQL